MKYEGVEGDINELVSLKLDEIEKTEQVKVLHAVESGSRAWGFASPDSDYDVRFVYVRSGEFYLRLAEAKDVIDWELNETLDINGWDLDKTLRLFHKSNATLFEWANSPVIYRTTAEWRHIYGVAKCYFSRKACMYHYYGTAKSNYELLTGQERVKYKKYFYVLRPILACLWIGERKCPPPVRFEELVDSMLGPEMRREVGSLLREKTAMKESDTGLRAEKIDAFIERNLRELKERVGGMKDDRRPEWEPLDRLFRSQLL